MNPLINIHLHTIPLSKIHISTVTLKTETSESLREKGPNADNDNCVDVRAAAAMCQFAYSELSPGTSAKAELIDGWTPMTAAEVNELIAPGFYQKLRHEFSGFSSMLFQKQTDGIRYYAYCTVGTDEGVDWVSNGTQGLTGLSVQHSYSVSMAKQIDRAIGDKAVLWFIGHSLGGGLASNNSLVTGRHAITFNAAGLNPNRVTYTLLWNNWKDLFHPIKRTERVHAFVLEGEILNSSLRWIGQSAYGVTHVVKLKNSNIGSLDRHKLTTLLDVWGMRYK